MDFTFNLPNQPNSQDNSQSVNNQVPNVQQQQPQILNLFDPLLNNSNIQVQQQAPINLAPQLYNPYSTNSNSQNGLRTRQSIMRRVQPENNQSESESGLFNDDQAIIQRVKQEKKDVKINIQIKAQRSMAKLKEEVTLPAMCSIKTEGGSRTSVDLICVIDVSGSMSGQKIQLVKSTMKYLLEALTPEDRLSIITFQSWGERLCGLKCVTSQNMVTLHKHINSLSARGGTNICSGLDLAVKTIKDRKQLNKVTSVFLLSDGQDRGAEAKFAETLKKEENNLGIFSIHSFGFGKDHDEDLMTKISQLKDGSFYFIKELATLDEAFSNALGGVISMVATDVAIKISNIAKNLVEGVKITKVYGQMWQKITDKQYKIKILQLMSGISKDYVFEISIPKIDTQVGDLARNHEVLEAIFTAKGVDNSNLSGECCFKITLLNQQQEIPEVNENIDVIQNHLRVIASQAIQQNMKKAEQNKFQQAQKGIDSMINHIQSNTRARKQKLESLVNDLQSIKQTCANKYQYMQQGKKAMKSATYTHSRQTNFAYSNAIQQSMVTYTKSRKMETQ